MAIFGDLEAYGARKALFLEIFEVLAQLDDFGGEKEDDF